jgi:hypothetical protein
MHSWARRAIRKLFLSQSPFLDSIGPLVVLQSKDVVSNRHDGLRIFVSRYRACDKENPEGRPRLIQLAVQFNFQRFAASCREQVEEQHCEQQHIATNQRSVRSGGS